MPPRPSRLRPSRLPDQPALPRLEAARPPSLPGGVVAQPCGTVHGSEPISAPNTPLGKVGEGQDEQPVPALAPVHHYTSPDSVPTGAQPAAGTWRRPLGLCCPPGPEAFTAPACQGRAEASGTVPGALRGPVSPGSQGLTGFSSRTRRALTCLPAPQRARARRQPAGVLGGPAGQQAPTRPSLGAPLPGSVHEIPRDPLPGEAATRNGVKVLQRGDRANISFSHGTQRGQGQAAGPAKANTAG